MGKIWRLYMTSLIDTVAIFILIMGAIVGFKRGIIQSATMFIGSIIVIVISFYLKNPLSELLYKICPFFNFGGDFEGLTVLNLVLYEAIAYILVYVILMAVLHILIKITNVFETILKFTIVLSVPSKILGAIFGILENFIFVYLTLFLLMQLPLTTPFVLNSQFASIIVRETPFLSSGCEKYYEAIKEVVSIKDKDMHDKNEYNKESLDILLKYDIVSVNSVKELIDSKKLEITDVFEVISKYERNDE